LKQRLLSSYRKLKGTNILSNFFNLSSIQVSNILLLFLTIRLITVNVGFEAFGLVMFAYRFALLAGAFINYGTGQSGVRETAYHLTDVKQLSIVLYNTLCIRIAVFILFLVGMFTFYWFHADYYTYLFLSIPIVLAEIFNPLCFFIGIEKLKVYNIYNLVSNIMAVIAIAFFIKAPTDAPWVNFILGMGNVITYSGLLIYLIKKYKLSFRLPLKLELLKISKDNLYLTINNVSANLQQSIIIFALTFSKSELLGAYSLCDRVIGQCRNLINTIANAIFPNAVHVYKQSINEWKTYRKKIKHLIAAIFFAGAILIFVLADFIVFTLSKEHDANSIAILRIMAFVPVISALNVINMLDLLLKNTTVYIFKVSMSLLVIAALAALSISNINSLILVACFTLIVESCAFLLTEYFIQKPVITQQNV
jgi:O-antigen/teichoic acid export membrane protein